MNMAFMNGTTYGKGRVHSTGMDHWWSILRRSRLALCWLSVCLQVVGIFSASPLALQTGHLATRMTGAYAYIRPANSACRLVSFEGVQESLGRIGGLTYSLEAMRVMTAGCY